jgi:hypothetical protein
MQRDGTTENSREQSAQRADGHEAALVFDQKFSTEIGITTLYARASLIHFELGLHIVVAETPAGIVGLGGDSAQWLEQFQEANVVVPLSLNQR